MEGSNIKGPHQTLKERCQNCNYDAQTCLVCSSKSFSTKVTKCSNCHGSVKGCKHCVNGYVPTSKSNAKLRLGDYQVQPKSIDQVIDDILSSKLRYDSKRTTDLHKIADAINQYLNRNRAKGHTSLLVNGLNNRSAICIVNQIQEFRNFGETINDKGIHYISAQNATNLCNAMRGIDKPLAIDHYVLQQIIQAFQISLNHADTNEAIYKDRIKRLVDVAKQLHTKLDDATSANRCKDGLEARLNNYNAMNWFQRLWHLIRYRDI